MATSKKEVTETPVVLEKSVPVVKENVSVESFIMAAIEKGLSVETMEKLFSLREKVKAEQAKEAFTSAMAKFQSECPIIEKLKVVMNKDGKTARYKYAPLDSIVSQVKKALANNGLSYSFDEQKDEKMAVAICKITHMLGHSEISSFKIPIGTEDYMNDAQKYGARMTFGKRYAFCNALGILTGDEDTDATEDKKNKKAKPPMNLKADIIGKLKTLGVDISVKENIKTEIHNLTGIEVNDDESNLIEIINRLSVLISDKNGN